MLCVISLRYLGLGCAKYVYTVSQKQTYVTSSTSSNNPGSISINFIGKDLQLKSNVTNG